jgi:hypothetical protein
MGTYEPLVGFKPTMKPMMMMLKSLARPSTPMTMHAT